MTKPPRPGRGGFVMNDLLRITTDSAINFSQFFANLLQINAQLSGHFWIKLTNPKHHFLMLYLDPLENLENNFVLMIKMLHDVADLFFAFRVTYKVVLGGQAVFFGLTIL